MTINNGEKHLEQKPEKSGDHQVAGTPITKTEDNAHQQRQEKANALKAFRFTKDGAPFTLDMGNGEKVQDKRPLKNDEQQNQNDGSKDLVPARFYPKTGKTEELGKDGKWHKAGSIPASQEAKVGEVQQGKDGNWHKTNNHQAEHAEQKHEHGEKTKDATTGAAGHERGLETQLRPHQEGKQFNEKDHLWHDSKSNDVVEPPKPEAYSPLATGLAYSDQMNYMLWKHEQETHEKSPAQGERILGLFEDNAASRPRPADKQFDDKDHMWHDKTGKVVEPPNAITYYPVPIGLAIADELRWQDYQKKQEQEKEKEKNNHPQGERILGLFEDNAASRPHPADKQFDDKDHMWHDKAGNVVKPPNPETYSLIPPGLAYADQMKWANWQQEQEKKKHSS
jgi:hypothetical protein